VFLNCLPHPQIVGKAKMFLKQYTDDYYDEVTIINENISLIPGKLFTMAIILSMIILLIF
jgi:hypothetical protein